MPISWYPGHMHKARKELALSMKSCDVVIELLDARIPAASSNPLLATLRRDIPCLKILTKSDLADAEMTARWRHYLDGQKSTACLVNGIDTPLSKEVMISTCRRLVTRKADPLRKYQALITGIPNVGKSTLLNQILLRKVARTGNEPAITRQQQRVRLDDEWFLIDTPGMLWPKIEDQQAACRLACVGSIRNTAIDIEDVAWFLAETLLAAHPECLAQRYRMDPAPGSVEGFFERMGETTGSLKRGGSVDWHRTSALLLEDFRAGRLGRISLESPPED